MCDVGKYYRCSFEKYFFTCVNLTGRHKGHHKLCLVGHNILESLSNLTNQENSGQPGRSKLGKGARARVHVCTSERQISQLS